MLAVHSELLGPSVEAAIGECLPAEAARDIGETIDLAEARGHRFKGLRDRREIREINITKATPRNKRVMLRFWVSEARLCNSILDGMRRL